MYCAFNVQTAEQPFADPAMRRTLMKRAKKRARMAARARVKGLPVPPEAVTAGPVANDPMKALIEPPSSIDLDTVLSWCVQASDVDLVNTRCSSCVVALDSMMTVVHAYLRAPCGALIRALTATGSR